MSEYRGEYYLDTYINPPSNKIHGSSLPKYKETGQQIHWLQPYMPVSQRVGLEKTGNVFTESLDTTTTELNNRDPTVNL